MQFSDQERDLLIGCIYKPSVCTVLETWHAFASDRIGDYGRWLSGRKRQRVEDSVHLSKAVAIYLATCPAECFELLSQRVERDKVFGSNVGLETIPVDNRNQVVELPGGCDQACFPDRALVQLAVTQDDKYLVAATTQLDVDRYADTHRKHMAKRP